MKKRVSVVTMISNIFTIYNNFVTPLQVIIPAGNVVNVGKL
ncbi:hypothetical protein [Bacillus thuringiensis]|nr:hypothetical protein [Bacillus thuringiensis]